MNNLNDGKIELHLEDKVEVEDWSGLPGWNGYSVPTDTDTSGTPLVQKTATLSVHPDFDSSSTPNHWIWLCFFTEDEPFFKLSYSEAEQLRDRLTELLGS